MMHRAALVALTTAAIAAAALAVSSPPLPPAQTAVMDSLVTLHLSAQPDSVFIVAAPHVAHARQRGDRAFLRELLLQEGGTAAAYGRAAQAEPILHEAFDLSVATDDTSDMIASLRWLCNSVQVMGRTDEAAVLCDSLARLALAVDDSLHYAWALVGTAYTHLLHDDLRACALVYRRAAKIFAQIDEPHGEIWSRNGRALALRVLGRFREAMAEFRRSAALAHGIDDAMNEAMSWNYLGTLESVVGDPALAVTYFRRAHEIHVAHFHTREAVPAAMNIALALASLGQFDDAIAGLEAALADCRREQYPDLEGDLLNSLAEVRLQRHQYHEAAGAGREVLALEDRVPPRTWVTGNIVLSEALAAQDSLDAALRVLDACARSAQGNPNVLLAQDLALARGRLLLRLARPDDALALVTPAIAVAHAQEMRAQEVDLRQVAAQAWRALASPDSALAHDLAAIAAWDADRSLPTDPRWREQRGAAGRDVFVDAASLLLEGTASHPSGDGTAAAFDLLQRYKARTLQERIWGPMPRGLTADADTLVTLHELQTRVLRTGEVFLDAYVGTGASLLFAVARDTCVVATLPGDEDLTTRVDVLVDLFSHAGPASEANRLVHTGATLWRTLAAPVLPLVAHATSVVWSPDGVLHHLPLNAVLHDPGAAMPAPPCARVPAAAVLAGLREGDDTVVAPRGVLAVAAPHTARGEPLHGADAEVAWLAHRFRGVSRPRPAELAVTDEIPGVWLADHAVIHLAAHARLDEQRPWNSYLELTTRGDSLVLRASDVARLHLGARLAVLSSCASAGAQVVAGEGMLGLATGFLSAGVPAVIATLWPVDDATTARLMGDFYEALATGAPAIDALARAQARCRQNPATRHPFYWAGFVVVGDGATTVPLPPRRRPLWPGLLGAGALLAGCGWLTSRRAIRPAARA